MKVELQEFKRKEFILYGFKLGILDQVLRKVELHNTFIVFLEVDCFLADVGFEWDKNDVVVIVNNAIKV